MGSSREEADEMITLCAHDRKPATRLCSGCHKAPGVEGGHVATVWYCNKECQKADWEFHKLDCRTARTRRSLYRVAETAKLAFFRLVERNFDLQVVRVDKEGDTLYVWEAPKDQILSDPFPVNNLINDQDKQAVMTWLRCGSAEDFMHVLVEIMLQDIPFTVTEVLVPKVKFLRRVVVIEPNGHESDSFKAQHVIFKITINENVDEVENENYVLDFASAQFGFYDPLTPWTSYRRDCIETLGTSRPLGRLRDGHKLPCKDFGKEKGWDATRKALNDQFANILSSAAELWQERNGAFSAMLKLKEETFRKRREKLLDFIDERVDARKKELQRGSGSEGGGISSFKGLNH